MSKTSYIVNFLPKILRFTRFSGKIEILGISLLIDKFHVWPMTQASEDHRSRHDKRSKRKGETGQATWGDTVRGKRGLRRLRQEGMDRHNTHEDHNDW